VSKAIKQIKKPKLRALFCDKAHKEVTRVLTQENREKHLPTARVHPTLLSCSHHLCVLSQKKVWF